MQLKGNYFIVDSGNNCFKEISSHETIDEHVFFLAPRLELLEKAVEMVKNKINNSSYRFIMENQVSQFEVPGAKFVGRVEHTMPRDIFMISVLPEEYKIFCYVRFGRGLCMCPLVQKDVFRKSIFAWQKHRAEIKETEKINKGEG